MLSERNFRNSVNGSFFVFIAAVVAFIMIRMLDGTTAVETVCTTNLRMGIMSSWILRRYRLFLLIFIGFCWAFRFFRLIDPGFGALSTSQVQGDECAIDEGGEVLPGNTIQDEQCTNSYCWNDEYYSSFQGDESEGMGTAADECTPGEHCCNKT